ncbi:hypothetical protein HY091_03050 [Candidatus Kaiserbacteria bacterium]|nr:hypothetical protein [Candidatus Kaiserbacteria bacterium]
MIIKAPEKHLTDQEFFSLIKFFDYIVEKKPIDDGEEKFSISDLTLGQEEAGHVFNRVFQSGQVCELTVDIDKGYKFDEQLEEVREEAKKKPKKEQEELVKIINKIKKGHAKLEEIGTVSWIWYEVYSHIRLTPSTYQIPPEIEKILRTEMDKYLECFINDKLDVGKKNYYRFEAQKKMLIQLIEEGKKIALYGNKFILRVRIDERGVAQKMPDFSIIQTAYALQKLGYLKVVSVWQDLEYPKKTFDNERTDYDKEPSRYISANLILEDIFVDEINNSYKKNNPSNIFEKFDAKRGVLKFAGKDIELSKKGKETDAVLLLKTLLKEKTSEWKHNDEILEDWGYNDEHQKRVPKNKVYFAGQKINNAVALKTQIEDFVECNTTKARINPKYRKVDE